MAALREAENQADVFAAARFRSAPEDARNNAPAGAAAVAGGWFSETMLDALEKYQRSLRLAANGGAPSIGAGN